MGNQAPTPTPTVRYRKVHNPVADINRTVLTAIGHSLLTSLPNAQMAEMITAVIDKIAAAVNMAATAAAESNMFSF